MNIRNVWAIVAMGLGGTAILGALAVLKVDKDTLMWIGTLLLVPLATALVVGQNAETRAKVEAAQQQTNAKVDQVQQQTNGNTGRLMDIVEAQGKLLAQLQPPSTPVTADPVPPAPAEGGPPA